MLERFTDRARLVMEFARQEARKLGHDRLDTEHILLGMVAEGHGVAAVALQKLNITYPQLLAEVRKHVKAGSSSSTGELPYGPDAQRALDLSAEEADTLKHKYIGSEHLLLGILRINDCVAARALMNLGIKPDAVRQEIMKILTEGGSCSIGGQKP